MGEALLSLRPCIRTKPSTATLKSQDPTPNKQTTNHPENHLHHLSRDFHLPHQHPSSCLNKRTCVHSLPPPYFQEQLWSYWTSSHKGLERWLFASPSKGIVHILLYIFLILFFYSHCIYITATLAHKKPCFKIHKVILLFNSHFLIAFVLATFNTSHRTKITECSKDTKTTIWSN